MTAWPQRVSVVGMGKPATLQNGGMAPIEFRSDNTAGVAPEILAAVAAANTGSAIAYGADALTAQLQETVRAVFEHPGARVFPVTSGTAANALALSSMCPPWGEPDTEGDRRAGMWRIDEAGLQLVPRIAY